MRSQRTMKYQPKIAKRVIMKKWFDQAHFVSNYKEKYKEIILKNGEMFDFYVDKIARGDLLNPNDFFNEEYYLNNNLDVSRAIKSKEFLCGFEHFLFFGRHE